MRLRLLAWTVDAEPETTRRVYEQIESGAAAGCRCAACRNFDAARPTHYPVALHRVLASAFVEPRKERTVRLVCPLEGGLQLYAGCYLFCGRLLAGRPYRGFPFLVEKVDVFERLGAMAHVALRPVARPDGPWAGSPCVRIDVLVALPWVLREEPVPAVNLERCTPG